MFLNSVQDKSPIYDAKLNDMHDFCTWVETFRKLYRQIKNISFLPSGQRGVQFYGGLEDEYPTKKIS